MDVPLLKGYVNDYADMISSEAENELEIKLKAFEDSDSTQIVILTIPSLEDDALEDFSIKRVSCQTIHFASNSIGIEILS